MYGGDVCRWIEREQLRGLEGAAVIPSTDEAIARSVALLSRRMRGSSTKRVSRSQMYAALPIKI